MLSPETEGIDRREKFFAYTSLPTLQAYVLVAQDKIEVAVFRRGEPDWRADYLAKRATRSCAWESINAELPLALIYDRLF